MRRYLFSRAGEAVIVLLIVSLLVFIFIRLLPGDPAMALYGDQIQKLTPADQLRIRANLGLDEPLYWQYVKWLQGIMQGDWGRSYLNGERVDVLIGQAIGPTVQLMLAGTFLTLLLSLLFGTMTGLRPSSKMDRTVTAVSLVLMSFPTFYLALCLILVFSIALQWFPIAGMGSGAEGWIGRLRHLALPAAALALSHLGYYIRLLRNHVTVINDKEFVRSLRMRGVSRHRIIFRHMLPNAALPFLSYIGMSLSLTFAGSVVIETLFSWPGLGMLALKSAQSHDYPVLLAAILLSTFVVVASSLMIDLFCAWYHPQIRRQLLSGRSAQ